MVKRIFAVLTTLAVTAGLTAAVSAAEPQKYDAWTSTFDGAAVEQKKTTIFGDVTAIGKTGECANNAGLAQCASKAASPATKVVTKPGDLYALKLANGGNDERYALAVLNTAASLTASDITLSDGDQFDMSFEVYAATHSDDNGTTTVSLLGADSSVIASYTYETDPGGNITDVKIGGTTAAGFGAFQANSVSSGGDDCEAPNTFNLETGSNLQVKLTVKSSGEVTMKFDHERKNVHNTYTGTVKGGVSSITGFQIANSGTEDAARMYAIDTLTTTVTEADAPAGITVSEGDTYDESDGVYAKTYTFETPADTQASGVSVTVNGQMQTKTIANMDTAIKFGIIVATENQESLNNLDVSAALVQ